MKKFLIRLLVYCLVFTAIPAAFCAYVDPYNVMHPLSIRDNGVEPNKNYIKMTYILKNPDKFDSFIFGSSRVGNFHTAKIKGEKCYNMTYSNGIPEEHLANIKTFRKNGIAPKRIYLGVDSLSYTSDPADNMTGFRMSYEYLTENKLMFLKTYLDPAVVGQAALQVMGNHKPSKKYAKRFYKYGWNSGYNKKTRYDFSKAEADIGRSMRMEETLGAIKEIADICKESGTELIVFTNPMHPVTYEASLEKDYLTFLEKLAEITPYYNFSGYNKITVNNKSFLDSSHYTAEVSDMLIKVMCNGKIYKTLYPQGFGVYVTKDNVNDLVKLLESEREKYIK